MPIYDPLTKIITATTAPINGVVTSSVIVDFYSDAKNQWLVDDDLNKFVFPWRVSGGDPLPSGSVTPRFYFLKAPWVFKPYEADHAWNLVGNIFREDGAKLTTATDGGFTVEVNIITDVGPQQALGGSGTGSFTEEDRIALQIARDHARSADLQTQRIG